MRIIFAELMELFKNILPREGESPLSTMAAPSSLLEEGQNVFIRTVTYHYTGRIKKINIPCREMSITSAAWISDSGRFSDAMKTGIFSEVEPYPDDFELIINTDTIVDKVVIPFDLPRTQK